ncbi:MAG TPA: efflux transporter outer membrane subunit [Steroidobacteraceae bacterium]|jgi:NodT family efflux transporter outer membrane factor (OMF) lipoprotein|nr:efflux transporter outer membrane subunit [Steroidobacteraceae bacterium]
MQYRNILGLGLLAAGLTACVGPNYHTPKSELPKQYIAATDLPASTGTTAPGVDLAQWWHALNDPELDSLIERAVRANPDIEIALTRLQQARTRQVIYAGDGLPLVAADTAAGHGTGSDFARAGALPPLRAGDNKGNLPQIAQVAGFAATWEIDLFGGVRREIEAGRYDVQAAAAARNAVLISVVADVARNYVELRGLQMRLAILRDNIATAGQSRDLQQARFSRGLTNELDLQLAIREYSTLESELPMMQAAIDTSEANIAVLLGLYPEDLSGELSKPGVVPDVPAGLKAGMPVDLLQRRPDIGEAERELASATALIGVATSNLFPHVALNAGLGTQSDTITTRHGSHIWDFGPSVYWPLLDFGTLDAQVSVAKLLAHQRLVAYRKTVIDAVQDADNAISNYSAQQQRLTDLTDALTASQRAVNLAQQRYDRGLTDFLNVVDAERQAYALADQYTASQESAAEAFIYLYRALGGGWEHYQDLPPIHHPLPAVLAGLRSLVTGYNPEKQ